MLIFITGTSTSGKSTIAKELRKRGYDAYDLEHGGISAWFHKKTGLAMQSSGKSRIVQRSGLMLMSGEFQ